MALIGFMWVLFPLIAEQSGKIVASVPSYYQNFREWMALYPNQWMVRLRGFLPAVLPGLDPVEQTGQQMLASAGQAWGYVELVANGIFMTAAVLLFAFNWTLDGPRIIQSLLLLVPQGRREDIGEMVLVMETKVGFYIAGQSFLCLIIGTLALIAYLIIGLPNALVLAIIAGVLEAVPMIGPLLGSIPAAIIALSIAPSKLIWVIIATFVIQQIENSLLVPRVMRRAVGVNPFVTLLAFFAFSSLFGIAGALMAIPMAAIIQLLLDRFVFHPKATDMAVSTGRDYSSRLRYEAQDLAQDLQKQARFKKEGSEKWVKQTDHVMDEIEAITTDLDTLLAEINTPGAP